MSTDKITCLLNWHATPYHLPLFLAEKLNYFSEEGIKVAILEPNNPSDVTEIIGSGKVDLGCKAMIHTIAGKARGFPIKSIGTLLDEPFTGVVYLKSKSGITTDFKSLRGKRIGYVGEFGKIQLDELTRYYGMTPEDYKAVRVGMNVTRAIIRGEIDAGIGLENVQMVELEEWSVQQGRSRDDVQMLRIDELAELGCCCFCSVSVHRGSS
jgi:pyrimidine precursor biosynthesis enzyme